MIKPPIRLRRALRKLKVFRTTEAKLKRNYSNKKVYCAYVSIESPDLLNPKYFKPQSASLLSKKQRFPRRFYIGSLERISIKGEERFAVIHESPRQALTKAGLILSLTSSYKSL